ncbi:hypothetical protein ACLOJK_009399 [Asimina triloba]
MAGKGGVDPYPNLPNPSYTPIRASPGESFRCSTPVGLVPRQQSQGFDTVKLEGQSHSCPEHVFIDTNVSWHGNSRVVIKANGDEFKLLQDVVLLSEGCQLLPGYVGSLKRHYR